MPDAAPRTVPELLLDRVARTPAEEAFRHPVGAGWESLSWSQAVERIRAVACGLIAKGLEPEQRCAILSNTRMDWVLADYGILCAGGATTTIYPSSTADETAYILSNSGSVVAFVENGEQVGKLASRRDQIPGVRLVVVFDGQPGAEGWVMTLAQLAERGREFDAAHPRRFEERARSLRPDMLATLIYTSGTTGLPKGVELNHDCWVKQAAAVDASGVLDHRPALQFFWLPLAHSFGKMIGTAQLRIGFPTAIDGRLEKIVENLGTVRPTFVCAVPRIFEKVHNKVVQGAQQGGAAKHAIFKWALSVGLEHSRLTRAGKRPGLLLELQRVLADRLVFSKVRALFGGRLKFFVSGSAPLSKEVAEFFHALGILILEGYGLTESSAATHVNLPSRSRIGSVGPALPGMEVKIASDGEVLMRGAWIMRGYHGLPEQTAEALDAEGWLHTGDIGVVDRDGFLAITDRKKDLIKTSGGKYVAPQELEGRLKALSPYVSQVVIHGDRRNYCTALVTLDPEGLASWATQNGLAGTPHSELTQRAEVRAVVQEAVNQLNTTLPRYATVKKFTVMLAEFTEKNGEVTPSQKLKRKVIEQRYRNVLDAMYAGAELADR
ncbi:MAG TPA: long-chain fatty acid--CoA ligase [Anaeromyxobacteraceae bacterium]|nr:long-chain fatty acid--CoA ligase [Anaeromyxobacteraceae bacterium]